MPRWSPQGLQAPVGALHTELWLAPRVLPIQVQLMYTYIELQNIDVASNSSRPAACTVPVSEDLVR